MDDWYNITQSEIIKVGKERLINHFGGSLYNSLSIVYPEHEWQIWRFSSIPKYFWEDKGMLRQSVPFRVINLFSKSAESSTLSKLVLMEIMI